MRRLAMLAIAAVASVSALSAMTEQERIEYRNHLLEILPEVPSWRQWLADSRELPPDFDSLPKQNGLPDPLKFYDGRPVKNAADWAARREEIKKLFEKYDVGSIPPKPKLDSVDIESEAKNEDGSTVRTALLHFGPNSQGSLRVILVIPPGDGPFPVLIGGMPATLIPRGYIACNYPSSVDPSPTTGAPPTNFPTLYPEYDMGTMGQQALNAQMAVDYLYTVPQVDKQRIAIAGYSRGGKMATIAAVFDDRIAAVLAGSTGVGGIVPWRLAGERNQGESIQSTTLMFPTWFTQRLRYFTGREDRLPIDGNLLVAALAPRAILIEYGLNDEVSNDFASEAVLSNVSPLYKMLGKPEAVGLMRLPGTHLNGGGYITPGLDWLDIQFGRSDAKWDNRLLFPWDFDQWRQRQTDKFDLAAFPARKPGDLLLTSAGKPITTIPEWNTKAADLRKSIHWMLGEAMPVNDSAPVSIDPLAGAPTPPAGRGGPGGAGRGAPPIGGGGAPAPAFELGSSLPQPVSALVQRSSSELGWLAPQREGVKVRTISFGDGLKGDIYYPADAPEGVKMPTAIWLHGYSYPLGYMWVYKRDLHPILSLVAAGYAVFAYDQSGFGGRMGEFKPFYDRYPRWSQMGRLVQDARDAIDALQKDPAIAGDNISLYGYELGAIVALYTAALDPRVKGVIAFNGFTPMRTDTADKGTGGLARFAVERGLLPRLGYFIGHESQVPYDYQDLLALIAPRPAYVVAPLFDRDATHADVLAAVEEAKKVYGLYGAASKLMVDAPWDYARSPVATQDRAIQWLKQNEQPSAVPAVSKTVATLHTP